MDGSKFDDFARALVARPNRRGLLKGLIGAALGAVAAGAASDADAATCPAGQVYRRGAGCVCKLTGRPPGKTGCPCPTGQERCGGACVARSAFSSDPANCGACGRACEEGQTCKGGACVTCDGVELGGACVTGVDTCCTNEAANAQCAGGLSSVTTCQDCTQAPTAAGAFCGASGGNQCCGGSPACFSAVKVENDAVVCLSTGICQFAVACTQDGDCPSGEVCFKVDAGSSCCSSGETTACGTPCT